MKHPIPSLPAAGRRGLVLGILALAAVAHAQPGPGFALRFSDTNSHVAVPHTAGLNSFPLTVMAWVNTSQGTGQQGLVNKYVAGAQNGWNLFLKSGRVRAWYFVNNSRFVWDGGDGLDGGVVSDGAWHHLAFTVDASGGQLYVDGVLKDSRAWAGSPGFPTTTQEVRLGNYPGGVIAFNGPILLDEITVWRAGLNLGQVQSNLFTTLTGNEADLVAYYRCDEGSGSTIADSAPLGGNNNGTWVGVPRFVPTVVAAKPQHEGGTPPGDCSSVPGVTLVELDWRGQNLVGCRVELLAHRSTIQRVASDCTTTYYTALPPGGPRQWTILSQPAGANAQITPNGNTASLTLPRAGDYTVRLTICPGGCAVEEPGGASTFPLIESTGTIMIRAEPELALRAQELPVLSPTALEPAGRLDLSDSQRSCICLGGGGYVDPQWATVEPWNTADDYQLIEGTVVKCWPSTHDALVNHDLAFGPGGWYVVHDIGVTVSPDPRFFSLLSTKPEYTSNPHLIGCEAQHNTIPERFRPLEGDRVSLWGFWILDCAHEPYYTEVHPIVGWAVHRNLPVRIPDNETFTFDLVTNTVVSTAGSNLYVPGIVTDLWFNSYTGDATGGDNSSLAQPGHPGPLFNQLCIGGDNITESPIQRQYFCNIYLPKNPSQVFAEVGQIRPRAPLRVNISNPHNSPGPDPTLFRVVETTNGVTFEYLLVQLDLRGHTASTYSRRIEAAWVYPRADNWGLQQWRVSLDRLDIFDDLDSKLRWPGTSGDWVLWMMLRGSEQPWTRIRDGFNNTHGTINFSLPWQTGSTDPVFQRPLLTLDPQHRLGQDVLTFGAFPSFWMGGYEADEGDNDGDPGRIAGFIDHSVSSTWRSHNDVFAATVRGQVIATLSNGVPSAAAAELGRHYLLTCTNQINNRHPQQDTINPFATVGILAEGISGEPPWSPVDPGQIYGSAAALLGDVNGDGFPDVALGAGGSNVAAHLFLGGRNGFPPAPHAIASVPFPPSTGLTPGLTIPRTLVGASDANDDGIADLVIGTPTFANGQTNEGAVHLFSGAQLREGGSHDDSQALWAVEGNFPDAQLGYAVAAGDITHDGVSDVVVAAPFYQNSVVAGRPLGRVFVYFGSPSGPSPTPDQVLIPEMLIGSRHWFGHSVSMAGDVNNDGHTDVIIGAPRYTRDQVDEGAFYLYYGSPTGLVFNTFLLLEGNADNARFGHTVAGVGDVDGDHFDDVMVGAPFFSGGELMIEEGQVELFRGSAGGLIPVAAWTKGGGLGGAHFGSDFAGVGDLNGDGLADVAVGAPDEAGPSGLRGRVSYFLGARSGALANSETWRSWGVNGVAKLMINNPCCEPFISPCCNTGSTNKVDFNIDGFADALTFDSVGGGDPFTRVQLTLGRGQNPVVLKNERFFRATSAEPYAFQSIFQPEFAANMAATGQTNEAKISDLLARLKDIYVTARDTGSDPGAIVPMLQRLRQATPDHLFNQYFADVELDPGTAFYIDCGATDEYTDVLGREWLPDAPFLAASSPSLSSLVSDPITNILTGDRYLPEAMLRSERSFNGHIRYQVTVPSGWYTVLLYFSENSPTAVNPALGGAGCPTCERLFDLEVEGQRVSAYNQADAALPPSGDGVGRLYTATQVPFTVEVTDGLLDIAVLDRGPGNPPENAAIKGIAILGRPNPATKFATRPRILGTTRDGGLLGITVDLQASLARYLAGDIQLRLELSPDLVGWVTLPNLPEAGADSAVFSLTAPAEQSSFYRAAISIPGPP